MSTLSFKRNIQESTLRMVTHAKASHIGSCLSMADIVAVLYDRVLSIDPRNPDWQGRDRLILSKGHACAIVYAALAEKGFFPKEDLKFYGETNSPLMTHISHKVRGVEFSTGSLGHGLPFGVGKALGAKIRGEEWRTFVILGDGELDEGSNWEALLFAAHHELKNLNVIVDANNLQSLTTVDATLALEPLFEKFVAFGWDVSEVDGHDMVELERVLDHKSSNSKPKLVIARTVKGKGISFMENQVSWHYKNPTATEMASAIAEVWA